MVAAKKQIQLKAQIATKKKTIRNLDGMIAERAALIEAEKNQVVVLTKQDLEIQKLKDRVAEIHAGFKEVMRPIDELKKELKKIINKIPCYFPIEELIKLLGEPDEIHKTILGRISNHYDYGEFKIVEYYGRIKQIRNKYGKGKYVLSCD